MFIMTLGGFGDIWNEIPNTKHEVIGNTSINDEDTEMLLLYTKIQYFDQRQDSLVLVYRTSCHFTSQLAHCYDG